MNIINKYLPWCLALPLCLACTDVDILDGAPGLSGDDGGLVGVEICIAAPEAFSEVNGTRAISEGNESILDGRFAVFGFTGDGKTLQFVLKTGDRNTGSNLDGNNDYAIAYGDHTDSPSIAWHPSDASSTSGRLYIEYRETRVPVHLLVLANVDPAAVAGLLTADGTVGSTPSITLGESTLSDVVAALAPTLDFDVTSDALASVPMAGECDLGNGITLGSKGAISLRRSVAKFTVRVEYTYDKVVSDFGGDINKASFQPESFRVMNLNKYATVYSPSDDGSAPAISSLNGNGDCSPTFSFPKGVDGDALGGWTLEWNDEGGVYYKEVVFYVAETWNSRKPYSKEGDGSRISVLVGGQFHDDMDWGQTWYRLDLIPESATSIEEEIGCVLRNHHYAFVIRDDMHRGSTSMEGALALVVPDNFPFESGDGSGMYVVVTDEDILSITVEYYTSEGADMPYYVGVSSNYLELEDIQGACTRVKVVTNFVDSDGHLLWTIDKSAMPTATDGSDAISFVWDDNASTLWLWLDHPEAVFVGQTCHYYIVAGNIRKKMRITIVGSATND